MGQGDVNQSLYTRIDIAGPAPFNKLVFLEYSGDPLPADKQLNRMTLRATADFKLDGFDQTNPPPVFKHTTIGWVHSTGVCRQDAWLWACDDIVDGGFDDDGYFYVDVDLAGMYNWDNNIPDPVAAGFKAFSYLLIQEPQPQADPKHPPHGPMGGPHHGGKLNEQM